MTSQAWASQHTKEKRARQLDFIYNNCDEKVNGMVLFQPISFRLEIFKWNKKKQLINKSTYNFVMLFTVDTQNNFPKKTFQYNLAMHTLTNILHMPILAHFIL